MVFEIFVIPACPESFRKDCRQAAMTQGIGLSAKYILFLAIDELIKG